jgi:hypothetical protein
MNILQKKKRIIKKEDLQETGRQLKENTQPVYVRRFQT